MKTLTEVIKRKPVHTYYILVYLISWGGMLLVAGGRIFSGASWQTDPKFSLSILVMLVGPPASGVFLTIFMSGREGLHDLISRLVKWKASTIWYVVALLIAPLTQTSVLLSLSLFSPRFLPAMVLSNQKITLLVSGISVGLMGGLVEELGWTGFAIPRLRHRHTVFSTGLLVGVLWGLWHLLQMWWVGRTSSEGISLIIFMPQYFISAIIQLTAFRVLMVWVYDHTRSLLLSILMHASYIFSTLFVLAPPVTGIPFIIYSWVFAASLLIIVGVGVLLDRGMLSVQEESQD